MKTTLAKKSEVNKKWLVIDAAGAPLGRLAAKVAPILMGKTKPIYTPNVDTGDFVVVVNAEKIKLTGKKEQVKEYDYYTLYPGGSANQNKTRFLRYYVECISVSQYNSVKI